MKRREFITLLGGAAAWPLAARAQQPERMRRIAVILNQPADDLDAQARLTAFLDGLQQLSWTDGRNVRIDIRWAAGDPDRMRKWAAELAVLAPDVILATGSFGVGPTAGDSRYTDRICGCPRPGRCWLRRQFGAAGRQRHWISAV